MFSEEMLNEIAQTVEGLKAKEAGKHKLDLASKLLNKLTSTQGNLERELAEWKDGEIRKITRDGTTTVGRLAKQYEAQLALIRQQHKSRLQQLTKEFEAMEAEARKQRLEAYQAIEDSMSAAELGVVDQHQRRKDALVAEWDEALKPLRGGIQGLTEIVDKARARREAEKKARAEAEAARLAAKAGMKPAEPQKAQEAPAAAQPMPEPTQPVATPPALPVQA
jgi:pyruvate-formate lyase